MKRITSLGSRFPLPDVFRPPCESICKTLFKKSVYLNDAKEHKYSLYESRQPATQFFYYSSAGSLISSPFIVGKLQCFCAKLIARSTRVVVTSKGCKKNGGCSTLGTRCNLGNGLGP